MFFRVGSLIFFWSSCATSKTGIYTAALSLLAWLLKRGSLLTGGLFLKPQEEFSPCLFCFLLFRKLLSARGVFTFILYLENRTSL